MKNRAKTIYLDHAAGTPVDPAVLRVMATHFSTHAANPSAMYAEGVLSRKAVERARAIIASHLKTQPACIYFTGGGTEANNLAIFGLAKKQGSGKAKKHIITTAIEHSSVLEPMRELQRQGWSVTHLPVDSEGIVAVEDVEKALRPETVLVSIMFANNEVGSIQPIADIGRILLQWRKKNGSAFPYFHVDACQATEYLSIEVDALHADFLTINAAKVYGPKGTGVLYKRRGVEVMPVMHGGRQERGLRSGSENVPAIVGFGKAVEIVYKQREKENRRISELRNYFWKQIKNKIDSVELNGPVLESGRRLANNLNISFAGCDAEALILYLDVRGIAVAAGSACSTDSEEISHVLAACGYDKARARSSIRFTLGRGTTKKDIDTVMKVLPNIVQMVRTMNSV